MISRWIAKRTIFHPTFEVPKLRCDMAEGPNMQQMGGFALDGSDLCQLSDVRLPCGAVRLNFARCYIWRDQ